MPFRSSVTTAARLVLAAFAVFVCTAAAQAQLLTYVSSSGVDTRPCTVQTQPCRTLQRAVNVTSANGEVRVLSNLTDGAVVTKSITINGTGSTVIGMITVNNASARVTLRDLTLDGVGSRTHGINVISAAAVYIDDCTVERFTSDGIVFNSSAATKLFVSNTVSRSQFGNGDGLHIEATNAEVLIEDSRFEGNAFSGVYLKVAKANVSRSVASGNSQNGIVLAAGRIRITETTADDNSQSGFSVRTPWIAGVWTFLDASRANGNGAADLEVVADAAVAITNCVFLRNINNAVKNQGRVFTFQNNAVFTVDGNALEQNSLK